MIKFLRGKLFSTIVFFYSLLVALFWTALRINWAGISKFLGADTNRSFIIMQLPLLICIFLWLNAANALYALLLVKRSKMPAKVSLIISILFTVAIGVIMYFGSFDYIAYIGHHFLISLIYVAAIFVIAWILFTPRRAELRYAPIGRFIILFAIIALCVFFGYAFKINYFTCEPAVYAVGEEYQIVFATNDNSIAWAEVGENRYYDLNAGSMKSSDLVHKITVPQEVLDEAGGYTVHAQKMVYRGPFGGYLGGTISESREFRAADRSDGLDYYCLSDVHASFKGATNAATKAGELDFLVIIGDTVSMVERECDALAATDLAADITHGEYPVVYARGNHEIKGEYAEELYKYVGSKDEKFYYSFRLGDIYGVVLDLGEDHDDDWWEYYNTSKFNVYRNEQLRFLEKEIEDEAYADAAYKLCICHIPMQMINARHNHEAYKPYFTSLLNKMGIDVFLCGHQHDLNIFEPGVIEANTTLTYNKNYSGVEGKVYEGYLTDFDFYGFIVGRAANSQLGDTQVIATDEFTGLHMNVNFGGKMQTAQFTNSEGAAVPVCNIFGTEDMREKFEFPLVTISE